MSDYEIPEQYKERELLVNKIQCPDGTILESRHRHDYREYKQEDGRFYMIDGGLHYSRRCGKDYIDLCVYTDDPHDKIREHFAWGRNYDKNGKKLPQTEYILLKDLEDDHVKTLCYYTLKGFPAKINKVFVDEWNIRVDNA